MRQAHTCGRVGPLAWLQVLQNSGSWMFRLRVKTLSAWDRRWRNPRQQNYREHSNIKARTFSPRPFRQISVHWHSQCHAKRQGTSREFQHSAGLESMSPDSLQFAANTSHLFVSIYPKKNSIWRIKLETNFCVQDLHFLIGQVKCWGQTRYTRILHREPLIYTYFT